MSAKTADGKTKRKLHVDKESRALMASPAFREVLEAGRKSAAPGLLCNEHLDHWRPISREEAAEADEFIARLLAKDRAATENARHNEAARR